jgi:hypothetical protein
VAYALTQLTIFVLAAAACKSEEGRGGGGGGEAGGQESRSNKPYQIKIALRTLPLFSSKLILFLFIDRNRENLRARVLTFII